MVFRECGCRTYMSDHPNLFVPMVEYCPMHEAAPDMLAALKVAQKFIQDYFRLIEYDDLVDAKKMGFDSARKEIDRAIIKSARKETGDYDRSS